jgi:Tfp pilus assembly protein PilF
LWPFDLSAMYVVPPAGKTAAYAIAAVSAAALALLWLRFRRNKEAVFGAAFFVTMLLPVLQFIPFGPVLSADRYTYLSSIGIFILGAVFARGVWRKLVPAHRKIAVMAAACAVVGLATASRVRCAVWKDGVSLWNDTLRKQPQAAPALINLCGAYIQTGNTADAENCLALAMRKYPDNDDNYYNLGFLYAKNKEFDKAEKSFARTLALSPCRAAALNNMGNLRLLRGAVAEAERYYGKAVQCDGAYAASYVNLGKLALSRKDLSAAAQFYKKALSADPADSSTRAILATMPGGAF